jgi:hypothetical protein
MNYLGPVPSDFSEDVKHKAYLSTQTRAIDPPRGGRKSQFMLEVTMYRIGPRRNA